MVQGLGFLLKEDSSEAEPSTPESECLIPRGPPRDRARPSKLTGFKVKDLGFGIYG